MEYQLENFKILTDKYILAINKLLDYSIIKNLVPIKLIIGIPLIKQYIINNKSKILESGIEYILKYKDQILNFSIDSLDSLDNSNSSNSSNNYISNIEHLKNVIQLENTNNNSYQELEILNLIIDIKDKAKNLANDEIEIIKSYIELIVMILEKIKSIFTQ